jgi:hypothetical protein
MIHDYDNEMNYVDAVIHNEGFDYTFIHYSNFDDVKDKKFHKLREEYLISRKKLNDYIKKNKNEI